MERYIIDGSRVLSGEVRISGAKNAALPIAAAALLTEGAVIYNCPDLSDIRVCIDILTSLGCKCDYRSNVLSIEPYGISCCKITKELCARMRSSVTFLGALMGKCQRAELYCPGGCALGERPIDIHLEALADMGAEITCEENGIICKGALRGADITLRYPSVGATENIILAAVKAKGSTTLRNCAREPEICALADFLNMAGARISGAGSPVITVEGVEGLHRCEYTVPGDRIEAGTYMCAAAITGGELFIRGVDGAVMGAVTEAMQATGCVIKESRSLIYIDAPKRLAAIDRIVTEPYPGFPTDMQAQFTSVLSKAEGMSVIEESVFEQRNKHIPELNKMGADISCTGGRHFEINGVCRLKGSVLRAYDLRGGAALAVAALGAEGRSIIYDNGFIRRGYERFAEKLSDIGAEISCEEINEA